MKPVFVILMCLSLTAGCNTSSYYKSENYNTYDPAYSKAMNIILAGGITTRSKNNIRDVPYDQAESALREAGYSDDVMTVMVTGMSAAKFSGNMLATPGISDAMGGTLMLLHALTKVERDPVRYNGMIIWMPRNRVADSKEAAPYLKDLLTQAFLASLPDQYEYSVETRVHKPTFGDAKTIEHHIIKGGRCDEDPSTECNFTVTVKEPSLDRPAPSWMSMEPAYHWSTAEDTHFAAIHVFNSKKGDATVYGKPDLLFFSDEILSSMSKRLPEWINFYSPYSVSRNFPVVYNNGRAYLFIQPKPNNNSDKVTAK